MSKNFEKTLALVEEILLEPRWDEKQFDLAKSRIINSIKRNAASPDYLASKTLNKLILVIIFLQLKLKVPKNRSLPLQ